MKYYKELYVSDELKKKKDKVIIRLEQGKLQLNLYIIVLTENGTNHLEFFNTALLKQGIFAERDFFVVGIAKGYENTLALVEEITQEVYEHTDGADIRSYILKRQRESGVRT